MNLKLAERVTRVRHAQERSALTDLGALHRAREEVQRQLRALDTELLGGSSWCSTAEVQLEELSAMRREQRRQELKATGAELDRRIAAATEKVREARVERRVAEYVQDRAEDEVTDKRRTAERRLLDDVSIFRMMHLH